MEDFCVVYDEDPIETAHNMETNYNLNHPTAPVEVSVVEGEFSTWSDILFRISLVALPLAWVITGTLWMVKMGTYAPDGSALDQWVLGWFVFSLLISLAFGCVFLIKSDRAYKFEFTPREELGVVQYYTR